MESTSQTNGEVTIIDSLTHFDGTIKGGGKISIQGFVRGDIKLEGDVDLGAKGRVEGSIQAENVFIHGYIKGNAKVLNRLSLSRSSTVEGDVEVVNLLVEEGAKYCGQITMPGKEEGRSISGK